MHRYLRPLPCLAILLAACSSDSTDTAAPVLIEDAGSDTTAASDAHSTNDAQSADAEDGAVAPADAGTDTSEPPTDAAGDTSEPPRDAAVDSSPDAPPDGSSNDADTPDAGPSSPISCDVLVVGNGTGAVAAAHEAATRGAETCLVSDLTTLGGQLTSQGVSALDEGGHQAEAVLPFNKTYRELRQNIRNHYLSRYQVLNPSNEPAEPGEFDPGSCWVSRLCFEPAVAENLIENLLAPLTANGTLRIYRGYYPKAVDVQDNMVRSVDMAQASGALQRFETRVLIDATELGDLLPLAGIPYRTGTEAKSAFNEPSAPAQAIPECVQPFTYSFYLEQLPEGTSAPEVAMPPNYDPDNYGFGSFSFGGSNGFWSYRRVIDRSLFGTGFTNDIAVINWLTSPANGNSGGGNDFNRSCGPDGCNIIDKDPATVERILARARDHALGLAYWLQHDAPRPGGGRGYPNLKLRPDITGTADGLTQYPYIREARRLESLVVVREQDIIVTSAGGIGSAARANLFSDSIGTGAYSLDLHPCAVGQPPQVDTHARPFQIPAGALVPQAPIHNFIAAAKNIGTTHISNGSYRLQPVEWNIGLAAGELAALSLSNGIIPRSLVQDKTAVRRWQHSHLQQRGGRIFWYNDVDPSDGPLYEATQMLAVEGVIIGFPDHLGFDPNTNLTRAQAAAVIVRQFQLPLPGNCQPSFSDVPCSNAYYGYVQALANAGITSGYGDGTFHPDEPIQRAHFVLFMGRAMQVIPESPCQTPYTDLAGTNPEACGMIEALRDAGILQYDPGPNAAAFDPSSPLRRRSAAVMLYGQLKQRYGL